MTVLTPTGRGRGIQCKMRQKGDEFEPFVEASIPSEEYVETQLALYLRKTWMRAMGMPQDEIEEYTNSVAYPVSLAEELENLQAMAWIQGRNAAQREKLNDRAELRSGASGCRSAGVRV